ncbi:hypothetical protein ACKWTF_015279 [Chironomus riparius]
MKKILKTYLIFLMIYGTKGQTVNCDYQYNNNFWMTSYQIMNDSGYTCSLITRELSFFQKLSRFRNHKAGHNDADVKWIINYKESKMKTFSSSICHKFPNLEIIDIGGAEMESIDDDALSNCKNLNFLMLNGNEIREVPEYLLTRNSKLIYFWINNNQLTTLPENVFINKKELVELLLNNNQINFIPSSIFRQLVKLVMLNLDNNELQSINPEWFVGLQNLKLLSLNRNQIVEIPSKCFAALKNLEKLFIYGNRIKTLKTDNFGGLQNLQILSLHNNELSDLPVGVFTQLSNLQDLSLNSNKLTIIHSDSFDVYSHLTAVDLEDNKINAIDPKVIDNTAVSALKMTNNSCCQLDTETKKEIKANLKKCFNNYQPRHYQANAESCGKGVKVQGTIIGGIEVKRGMYPWIAALIAPRNKYFCGGTLISKRKVVTAAHCMLILARDITVLLGVHDFSKRHEVGRFPYAVQNVYIHPDWNPNTDTYDADIAIMVLETEVTYSKYIQPICLMYINSTLATKMEGVVVGYGKDGDPKKLHSIIPKSINLPIHKNEDCFLKNYELARYSSKRTFCGGAGNGTGVCMGDSGSGLVVTDGSAYYLRGIVSASLNNMTYGCDVDTYSIFTNILHFTDWINELPVERVF